jgi:hypothetical protein
VILIPKIGLESRLTDCWKLHPSHTIFDVNPHADLRGSPGSAMDTVNVTVYRIRTIAINCKTRLNKMKVEFACPARSREKKHQSWTALALWYPEI